MPILLTSSITEDDLSILDHLADDDDSVIIDVRKFSELYPPYEKMDLPSPTPVKLVCEVLTSCILK